MKSCPHWFALIPEERVHIFSFPLFFSGFPFQSLLAFLYFSLGLLSLAPSFPTWVGGFFVVEGGGGVDRILVSCFSLASKP